MTLKEWDELANLYKDEPANATYNMKSQRKGFKFGGSVLVLCIIYLPDHFQ